MAKRKINKSQEIRDFVKSHPQSSAKEVVAALKSKGVAVTAQTVATVKSKSGLTRKKLRSKKSKSPSRQPQPSKVNRRDLNLDLLIAAKKFSLEVGSADKAIAAIQAYKKLESVSA